MKYCTACKTDKPVAEFSKNKRLKDGLDLNCKACVRARSAAHYLKNKEKSNARSKQWQLDHPERAAEFFKKWKTANPEKVVSAYHKTYIKYRETYLAADKARRESCIDEFRERERRSYRKHVTARLARNLNWRLKNGHVINAYASERRAALARRTPGWLTEVDEQNIRAFYLWAKTMSDSTGILHHVDHIVPLRGKTVSGLHVPWNLQVIPAVDNLRKNNRLEVTNG